ncbi:MAG: adenosine-3(2),5-bisphosphate nucleotidase [Candidatus Eremiobacteraeota bacterium]|nr:adenosine-3(2),5-bisphosphate nucleotidase [Candidatus Eremiobacteraeota bacterium]
MLLRTGDDAALLAEVSRIALLAGDAIRRIERGGNYQVWRKPDASALTQADLAANDIIVDALQALDPQTPVISEEGRWNIDGGVPERFWLVDPLDGTREFVAGNGEYTVNIALVEGGEPTLGVVHVPAHGITYSGARGTGATRTDAHGTRMIHARRDGELVVVVSRSHAGPLLETFLAALPPHRTVPMGSALKSCLVADGTAQLYPRLGPTCWWDTAAAHAVALECGADVTALDGSPLRYDGATVLNPSFVCSSVPPDLWLPGARAVERDV